MRPKIHKIRCWTCGSFGIARTKAEQLTPGLLTEACRKLGLRVKTIGPESRVFCTAKCEEEALKKDGKFRQRRKSAFARRGHIEVASWVAV